MAAAHHRPTLIVNPNENPISAEVRGMSGDQPEPGRSDLILRTAQETYLEVDLGQLVEKAYGDPHPHAGIWLNELFDAAHLSSSPREP